MSASLVGSEMCIRDSLLAARGTAVSDLPARGFPEFHAELTACLAAAAAAASDVGGGPAAQGPGEVEPSQGSGGCGLAAQSDT
eukprot:14149465-Alexandrium_andersonii.AAC.1